MGIFRMVNLKNSKIVVKSQGNNLKSPPGGPGGEPFLLHWSKNLDFTYKYIDHRRRVFHQYGIFHVLLNWLLLIHFYHNICTYTVFHVFVVNEIWAFLDKQTFLDKLHIETPKKRMESKCNKNFCKLFWFPTIIRKHCPIP